MSSQDSADSSPKPKTPLQRRPESPRPSLFGRLTSLALVFVGLHLVYVLFLSPRPSEESSDVTQLFNLVENEQLESLHVSPRANEMMLITVVPKSSAAVKETKFALPAAELLAVSQLARAHKVTYKTVSPEELSSDGGRSILSLLFLIFPILLALSLLRAVVSIRGGGGFSSLTRSMNLGMGFKLQEAERPDTKFSDVAGMPGAKTDLQEIVEFLKDPTRFIKLGARIPRGVLLKGAPGTGKTLIARATAGEANVPFYSFAGSDFVQMFVGVGASRVRDLFAKVKEGGPGIIFLDEIDALGKSRANGAAQSGGHDEREQTLNALLVEMDGFAATDNIIVIAATNRPDVLDPALLRPGRFDRHVDVTRPHEAERLEILKVHTRKVPLNDDVDLQVIARFTMGFTGADLANLVNEACLFAARRDKTRVSHREFEDGFNRAVEGVPGTLTLNDPLMRKSTAAHEAGHTAVAHLLRAEGLNEVHSTSIKPGISFLGRMRSLPRTELAHVTRRALIVEMAILYGGRGGEIAAGESEEQLSAGAADDLRRMTNVAEHMVYEYGFGKQIGNRTLRESDSPSFYDSSSKPSQIGAELQRKADEDVKALIEEATKLCLDQLRQNKNFHAAITARLESEEEVRGSELESMLLAHPTEVAATTAEQSQEATNS